MRSAIAAVWAVIVCAFFLQTGNGLQTDLIGVRADGAFASTALGLMLSGYYLGYALGPWIGRVVVGRVGHAPALFLAVAVATVVIVVQPLLISLPLWTLLRLLSGFALSLSYVAVESWINASVRNTHRGSIFSLYLTAQMIGMTLAQALFAVSNPNAYAPFLAAAGLFVMAALPVAFVRRAAASDVLPSPFGLRKLFAISPLGAVATTLSGTAWAILFTFGPVYAKRIGLTVADTGWFMAVAMVAGGVLQIPLGWFSDRIGRRPVLALMFGLGVAAAIIGWMAEGRMMNFLAMALAGAGVFPIYAVAVAHSNDRIEEGARVSAAAGLVLLFGAGSFFGPLLCGAWMDAAGPSGFFGLLGVTMAIGLGFTAWRGAFSTKR